MKFVDFMDTFTIYRNNKFQQDRPFLEVNTNIKLKPSQKAFAPVYIVKRVLSDDSKTIHRLNSLPLKAGEAYYLRTIVLKKALHSFEDAKTNAGIIYPTYQECAVQSGYISDTEECIGSFREFAPTETPRTLRHHFTVMALEGYPVLAIFNDLELRGYLMADFLAEENPINHDAAFNKLLLDLYNRFEAHDKTLTQFGLPEPTGTSTLLERHKLTHNVTVETTKYNLLNQQYPRNEEQETAFQFVADAVKTQTADGPAKLIFLSGDAGTGKTTLAKQIAAYVRSLDKTVLGCASTALAANNYGNDFSTAHLLFSFPVVEEWEREDNTGPTECTLLYKHQRHMLVQDASLIIWDEFPSNHREVFEASSRCLDEFKGKVILCMGDWKQILPVIKAYSTNQDLKSDIINACICSSPVWSSFQQLELSVNMRLQALTGEDLDEQTDYAAMIKSVGLYCCLLFWLLLIIIVILFFSRLKLK